MSTIDIAPEEQGSVEEKLAKQAEITSQVASFFLDPKNKIIKDDGSINTKFKELFDIGVAIGSGSVYNYWITIPEFRFDNGLESEMLNLFVVAKRDFSHDVKFGSQKNFAQASIGILVVVLDEVLFQFTQSLLQFPVDYIFVKKDQNDSESSYRSDGINFNVIAQTYKEEFNGLTFDEVTNHIARSYKILLGYVSEAAKYSGLEKPLNAEGLVIEKIEPSFGNARKSDRSVIGILPTGPSSIDFYNWLKEYEGERNK